MCLHVTVPSIIILIPDSDSVLSEGITIKGKLPRVTLAYRFFIFAVQVAEYVINLQSIKFDARTYSMMITFFP